MNAPHLHFLPSGDGKLAVWEWPGQNPPLLFAHATSYHGRCWDHIISRFPGRRVLALDFRGHGSSSPVDLPVVWNDFARDVMAVGDHFDVRGALGIGHSMGGHSVVWAAIERPALFGELLLLDPVLFPPAYYGARKPDAGFILRRRNRWASPQEMFDRFHARLPFSAWDAAVLRNYCEHALRPEGDSFVLACAPELEAAIYELCTAPECNLYARIPSVTQPVTLLRAGNPLTAEVFDLSASPAAPDAASKFPQGRDVYLPEHNHYIPMEAPDLVAAEIARFCAGC